MASLLRTTTLNDEQTEYADCIDVSSHHLLGVISDILDFNRLHENKLELLVQPFDLRALIEESIDITYVPKLHREIVPMYWMEENLPPQIKGDVQRIRQILVNLLSNGQSSTAARQSAFHFRLYSSTSHRICAFSFQVLLRLSANW